MVVAQESAAPAPRGPGFHGRAPNHYATATADNAATRLDAQLESGVAQLPFDEQRGYLLGLLERLDIPVESQTLVFSKTSKQRQHIGPSNPRAVYFGRDAYVGWIPGAPLLEIAVGDDRLGLAFYTLAQRADEPPRIVRDDSCLSCHGTSRTRHEPGLLARSVFPDAGGEPIQQAPQSNVQQETPIAERWGGWLVTGTISTSHRGNAIARRDDAGGYVLASRRLQSIAELDWNFRAERYPRPTSDIGALLALEHHVTVHNAFVRALMVSRVWLVNEDAAADREVANRIDDLAHELVRLLLLERIAPLAADGIVPDPEFTAAYSAHWPMAADGSRLGELDENGSLFSLPLSPLLHSPAFARLPEPLRRRVLHRLNVAIRRGVPPGHVELSRAHRARLDHHLRGTLSNWPPPRRARR
ncbi:MAG: hypothetical protein NXI31_21770 [bacterium]|nr:hypothetical protein [bacterium]